MTNWPTNFPCPLIAGHSAEGYAGVIRTPFQAGNTKQRRIHKQLPHSIQLAWVVKQDDWGVMLNWMNMKAWDWFSIKLPGALAGLHKVATYPYTVRLISDLQQELIHAADGYYWRVSATAEWMPSAADFGPTGKAFASDTWIVAGDPAAPSAPDWIVAGVPGAPSIDVISAGMPDTPAARI